MWLVIDIGNSTAKGGLFDGNVLRRPFDFDLTPPSGTVGAWEAALQRIPEASSATRAGLASVVPTATEKVRVALQRTGLPEILEVHADLCLPFTLRYRTPQTLGADRLAAATAAWTRFGDEEERPVLVLDAGTAITYEIICPGTRGEGIYEGGVIAPGPALLQRVFREGTAQLPAPALQLPPHPVGRSTQESLQSGIMYGLIDSATGMIERIKRSLDAPPVVVATGGWGSFLEQHLDRIDYRAPHLVLHGIRTLMALNGGVEERGKERGKKGGEE